MNTRLIGLASLFWLALSAFGQPVPAFTAYTWLFQTNATAAQARAYLGVGTGGGSTNWVDTGSTNSSLAGDAYAHSGHFTNALTLNGINVLTNSVGGSTNQTTVGTNDFWQGGITADNGKFTNNLTFPGTNTAGLILRNLTTAQLANLPTPPSGAMAFNTDSNRFMAWDGSAWHQRVRLDGDTMYGDLGTPAFKGTGTNFSVFGGGTFDNGVFTNGLKVVGGTIPKIEFGIPTTNQLMVVRANELTVTNGSTGALGLGVQNGTTNIAKFGLNSTGDTEIAQSPGRKLMLGNNGDTVVIGGTIFSGNGGGATTIASGSGIRIREGSPQTNTATLDVSITNRNVTGTSDNISSNDWSKYITYTNASAIAVAIPQPGTSNIAQGFWVVLKNLGAGIVTVTPTSANIDGNSTIDIGQGQSFQIFCDGNNYHGLRSSIRGSAGDMPIWISAAGAMSTLTGSQNQSIVRTSVGWTNGSPTLVQTFSAAASGASGTWTNWPNAKEVTVIAIGPGGGGGGGCGDNAGTARIGGGGGGGGARVERTFAASQLPATVTVTVWNGGTAGGGGSAGAGTAGNPGTNTTFGAFVLAGGGGGGKGGTTATVTIGGGGGGSAGQGATGTGTSAVLGGAPGATANNAASGGQGGGSSSNSGNAEYGGGGGGGYNATPSNSGNVNEGAGAMSTHQRI